MVRKSQESVCRLTGRSQRGGWRVALQTLAFLLVTCHLSLVTASGQQPGPIFAVNSKAVQGVGPGNWTYGAEVNIYVSPTGNDVTGDGSAGNPYATIGRALQDVPVFVSHHYRINLGAGTYYEQVNVTGRYFGTNVVVNFNKAAIELKGDPGAPDSYVISGATAGNPTVPTRDYCVWNSYANVVLNGVSLQYAKVAGYWQSGGISVFNSVTLRHHTTASALAVNILNGLAVWKGHEVISDCYNGIAASHHALLTMTADPVNSGFDWGDLVMTSIVHRGIAAWVGSKIDLYDQSLGSVNQLIGTGAPGSVGLLAEYSGASIWWDAGSVGSFETLVQASQTGQIGAWDLHLQDATTGLQARTGGRIDMYLATDPYFSNVTTHVSAVQGGIVQVPNSNYFDGNWTSTGAVFINGGGANQDITLTPSGSGKVVATGMLQSNSYNAALSSKTTMAGNQEWQWGFFLDTSSYSLKDATNNKYPVSVGADAPNYSLWILPTTGNIGIGTGTVSTGQKLEVNGGMALNTTTAQPSCSSTTRGTFWVAQGGAGVKDNVQVCAKDASDTYAWRTIY